VQPENLFCPTLGFGVSVGGYIDVRLAKYLNLRLCPSAVDFSYINVADINESTNVSTMALSIPLLLKWSAERINNYRPYILAGGGVKYSYNQFSLSKADILVKRFNYFAEVGIGCDIYSQISRSAPEIKYQIGFNNLLPEKIEEVDESGKHTNYWGKNNWTPAHTEKYMLNITDILYHQVSFIFHFGSL
jgi:hypothetical protein